MLMQVSLARLTLVAVSVIASGLIGGALAGQWGAQLAWHGTFSPAPALPTDEEMTELAARYSTACVSEIVDIDERAAGFEGVDRPMTLSEIFLGGDELRTGQVSAIVTGRCFDSPSSKSELPLIPAGFEVSRLLLPEEGYILRLAVPGDRLTIDSEDPPLLLTVFRAPPDHYWLPVSAATLGGFLLFGSLAGRLSSRNMGAPTRIRVVVGLAIFVILASPNVLFYAALSRPDEWYDLPLWSFWAQREIRTASLGALAGLVLAGWRSMGAAEGHVERSRPLRG